MSRYDAVVGKVNRLKNAVADDTQASALLRTLLNNRHPNNIKTSELNRIIEQVLIVAIKNRPSVEYEV